MPARLIRLFFSFIDEIYSKQLIRGEISMERSLKRQNSFTEGKIYGPLIRFALPVLGALFLQSLYGAVDLLVVGQFSTAAEVSAVSTGSQIMTTFTNLMAAFAMGTTVMLGQEIGERKPENAGKTVGASIVLFGIIGIILSLVMALGAPVIAGIMQAPEEAFRSTAQYVRICGGGMIVIIAYNMIGSIFRGIGDSATPLAAVAIACVGNIFGDLLMVAVFHMGAAGAAIATVASQALSVVISLVLISRKELPFVFHRSFIRGNRRIMGKVMKIGTPIALQDFLVSVSFLVILSIVNSLGVTASAGVGVAEKVCAFIMLVPSAFMQSMAAFVSQNYGAGRMDRAVKGLLYAVLTSFILGVFMSWLSFFHGNLLAGIFTKDAEVVAASWDYLKAYAIDCLLTPVFFCFIGFYNGIGRTQFVMVQGILSAFCVRVPVSWMMSRVQPVSLFRIGLATPCSSALQTVLCIIYFIVLKHRAESEKEVTNTETT